MSDAEELDFELVTNASMLGAPPPLRKERVIIPDWKTTGGKKAAAFLVCEMSAGEFTKFQDAGWEYRNGTRWRHNDKDSDIRYLSFTIRDQHGNRIWSNVADAKAALGNVGRGSLSELLAASNRVNSAKEASSEGNSEEIQSDS